jgi:hypothetical protein
VFRAVTKGPVKKRKQRMLTLSACVAATWLAVAASPGCGSASDLIIGQNASEVSPEAGSGPSAGMGGTAGSGGDGAGSGGSAGPALAGDGGVAGDPGGGSAGVLDCGPMDVAPAGALVHRYSFDGTGGVGTRVKDSVGTFDGTLTQSLPAIPADNDCKNNVGTTPAAELDGNGQVVLDGCRGYVDLPNGIVSSLTDVTVVVWATWAPGGAAYARYFDFGVGTGENDTTTAQGSTFLTVMTAGNVPSQLQLAARSAPTAAEDQLLTQTDVNDNTEHQIAAVFASNRYAELYRDGTRLQQRIAISWPLSNIKDVNDWIGRSQWPNDHPFGGSFNEFRIYDQALSQCAIRALYTAGPNTL